MEKIGLVAGEGMLPVEFVKAVRKRGEKSVVFAIKGMADRSLDAEADKVYWLDIGQYKMFALLLLKERVRNMALLGKVDKKVIYGKDNLGQEVTSAINGLKDRKDYSILEEITRHLARFGVKVLDTSVYLSHLIPEKGIMTETRPDGRIEEDILFGAEIAKKMADMDIGQAIVVKKKSVVAVEAMEGTNATIKRAREIVGDGCVLIKVSRSKQDLRWDVPVVGTETMELLAENAFSALALESGKMYLVDREKFLEKANQNNIVVKVI